jgi:hypothetical protein
VMRIRFCDGNRYGTPIFQPPLMCQGLATNVSTCRPGRETLPLRVSLHEKNLDGTPRRDRQLDRDQGASLNSQPPENTIKQTDTLPDR